MKSKKKVGEQKQIGMSVGALIKKVSNIDVQFDLFTKCKLQTTMAERHKFVLNESAKAAIERGEEFDIMDLKNYTLVVRDQPIDIIDNGDHILSTLGSSLHSQRMGGIEKKKGKYNDAERLVLNEAGSCSVEVGEVRSWATI